MDTRKEANEEKKGSPQTKLKRSSSVIVESTKPPEEAQHERARVARTKSTEEKLLQREKRAEEIQGGIDEKTIADLATSSFLSKRHSSRRFSIINASPHAEEMTKDNTPGRSSGPQ